MADITLTITTDTHRAKLIIAILNIWAAHDGKGLIDLYDTEDDLSLAQGALWDVAWTIWGDEGLIDEDTFLEVSAYMDEYSRNGLWSLRKLCYKDVPEDPPARKEVSHMG